MGSILAFVNASGALKFNAVPFEKFQKTDAHQRVDDLNPLRGRHAECYALFGPVDIAKKSGFKLDQLAPIEPRYAAAVVKKAEQTYARRERSV